jgi:hypothetical protein
VGSLERKTRKERLTEGLKRGPEMEGPERRFSEEDQRGKPRRAGEGPEKKGQRDDQG